MYGALAMEVQRLRSAVQTMTQMAEQGGDLRDIILFGRLTSGDPAVQLTEEEAHILRSALGLDTAAVPHRSHIIAPAFTGKPEDAHRAECLERMSNAGWLRRSQPGMGVYHVTEAGAMALGYRLPR